MARAVLERLGLLPYFDHVQGTDVAGGLEPWSPDNWVDDLQVC